MILLGARFLRLLSLAFSARPGSHPNIPPSSSITNTVVMEASSCDRSNDESAACAIEFAKLIGKLKTTPRTGWVRRGVPRYESVADHSWRVAALTLLHVGRDDLDFLKCLQMAIVHDMAECIVGDIAPDDQVEKNDKQRLEKAAIERLAATLRVANGKRGLQSQKYLKELFRDYEVRESLESKVVKDLDLLDMIVQAAEYENAFGIDLSDFFDSTQPIRFYDGWMKALAEHVHEERNASRQAAASIESPVLSPSDSAFVEEYATATNMDRTDIAHLVNALRGWESRQSAPR